MRRENESRKSIETLRLSDTALLNRSRSRQHDVNLQGPLAISIYHRDGIEVVPLIEGGSAVIGRSPPAEVTIRDNSLSRQHAFIRIKNGDLWVEDLQSTNGTRLNGEKIDRAKLSVGDVLRFGAVIASVHTLGTGESDPQGLENHDRLRMILDAEVCRARQFNRRVGLLMIAADRASEVPINRWFAKVRQELRPFDCIALYSPTAVEILLPETTTEKASQRAAQMIDGCEFLTAGLGLLPDHATSAEALIEATRAALQSADRSEPVRIASPTSFTRLPVDRTDGPATPVIESPAMVTLYKQIERLASTTIPVLLLGETGVGKEVVAQALHQMGNRRDRPMICVNCGGIPSQLVESTLFGHERGAFTGANQRTAGVFESADGGIVLLDEIADMSIHSQVALLRVLETQRFCRVGSNREIEVDVRIIASTNQDLEELSKRGEFREDLLYRLDAMTLKIPPLRERTEEIEPLIRCFIHHSNKANDCRVNEIDEAAMMVLKCYPWPGNVRELRNAVARATVIAENDQISVMDLPERIRQTDPFHHYAKPANPFGPVQKPTVGGAPINLRAEINRIEGELVLDALVQANWNRNTAAKNLGLPVRTLAHKIQQHRIDKTAYAAGATVPPSNP